MKIKQPIVIYERYMQTPDCQRRRPDGTWGAARPIPEPRPFSRFKIAWGVLIGKYDALKWGVEDDN